MAQSIANLAIDLTANIAGFQSDLGRANRLAQKSAQQLEKDFNRAGIAIGAALGGGLLTLAAGLTKTVERLDKLGDSAKRISVSVESLSALGYAAKLSGSSIDAMEAGLLKLSKNLGQAAAGSEQLTRLFEALDISLTDTADVAAVKLGKALAGITDGSVRVAAATAAMGKGAAELIPTLLELGERGFDAVTADAKRFGAVVSTDAVAAAQKFGDNLDNLKSVAEGAFVTLAELVLPTVIELTEELIKFLDEARESGDLKEFAQNVVTVVSALDDLARGLAAFIAARFFLNLGASAIAFAAGLKEIGIAAGLARTGLALLGGPIGVLAGLIATAVVASGNHAESLRVQMEAADDAAAAIGRLNVVLADSQGVNEISQLDAELDAARRAATELFKTVDAGFEEIAANRIDPLQYAGGAFSPLGFNAEKNQKTLDELLEKIAKLRQRRDELVKQQASAKPTEDAAAKRAAELARILGGLSTSTKDVNKELSLVEKWMNAAKKAADPFAISTEKLTRAQRQFQEQMEATNNSRIDEQFATRFEESQRRIAEAQAKTAAQWEATWGNLYDSLGAAFGDFIAGNLESWEDFGDALNSIAKNFLSDLVRRFANTSLRMGTSGTGGIGGGSFGSNALWGNSQSVFGGQGWSMAGGVNAAAGLYSTYTQAQAGNQGGAALSGALTGAQIGTMIMPGIGTIVGAVIGGLVGWFATNTDVPSINVIGSDLIGTEGFRNLAPDAQFSTQLGQFAFASIDEVDAEARAQLKKAITDFDNAIASFLDDEQLARVKDALAGFNLQLQEGAISAENFIQARFDVILGTFDEATQEMVRGAGDLEAQMRKLGEVLQYPKLLAEMLDALTEGNLLAGMTEFERGIYQINKSFDEAIATAELLGATEAELAKIEGFRADALERLAQAQQAQLDSLLADYRFDDMTEGMTEFERETARINKFFDDLRDQAIALGASEEDLLLIERRRTAELNGLTEATENSVEAIAEVVNVLSGLDQLYDPMADGLESFRRAAQNVVDFLQGQIFGTSSASPLERLRAAQQQFEEQARLAAGGNIDAIAGLSGFAQRLLTEASTFFGVGSAEFGGIEGFIRSVLDPIGSVADAQSMPDVMFDLNRSLQALNAQLSRQGQTGTTDPNLLRAVNGVTAAVAETNRLLARAGSDRPRVVA